MIKLLSILAIFFSAHIFAQANTCSELDEGVFELYENKVKIGTIYRNGGIQVEAYRNDSQYVIGKYKNKGKCIYYLKNYKIKEALDTITWRVSYEKIGSNKFNFEGRPAFIDFGGYSYEGKLIKVSDSIRNIDIRKIFCELLP